MNAAIPFEVNGVAIDYLSPRPGEDHLAEEPGAFIDVARLVYMKIKASRLQDRADVAGLVKAVFDEQVAKAAAEE